MKPALLEHLVCPLDGGALTLAASEEVGGEVLTGVLTCTECGREYPILRGVPRMVAGALPADMAHTARNFAASWKLWKDIDDERYRGQFLAWLQPLRPEDFQERLVLDCGCGKGRHLRVVSQFGAKTVIGIDLSEAVDVAYANTRGLDNVHVVQADLLQPPLKSEFELAYSIGVLHHTPDPKASFLSMAKSVKPGGSVACWVYGRENNGWVVYLVNPIRLTLTRYLPTTIVKMLSYGLAALLFAVIYVLYVPARALGLRLFYMDYLLALREWGFQETTSVVHDHLIAPTAFYLRKEQVAAWFQAAGIVEPVLTWVRRMSWAGLGRVPVDASRET
jgi:SAM-dependent methyltransferase